MTTGVDILFKELPASTNAVERFSKSEPSTSYVDHAEGRSSHSKNRDEDKNVKSFSDHIDDQNVNNDKNRLDDTPAKPIANNEEDYEQANKTSKNSDVDKTGAIEKTVIDQNENVTIVQNNPQETKLTGSEQTIVPAANEILFAEKLPENTFVAQPNVTTVKNPEVIDNEVSQAALKQKGSTEITAPVVQNSGIIQASLPGQANETAKLKTPTEIPPSKPTMVEIPGNGDVKAQVSDPTTKVYNVNLPHSEVAQNGEITKDLASSTIKTPINDIVHQNGLGQDDTVVDKEQKPAPVPADISKLTTDDKNPTIKSETPEKPVEIVIPALPLAAAIKATEVHANVLENKIPTETVAIESTRTVPVVPVQSPNTVQKPSVASKSNAAKSNSNASSAQNTEGAKGSPAAGIQQATTQTAVKSDIFIDLGLTGQKPEPLLPQNININGQTSLSTGNLLALQDINSQKPIDALAATIKSETNLNPKMVNDQITIVINKNIVKGQNNFSIRLNPAELGQVDIRLEFTADGKMQASMIVENEKTLSMLQRDQASLEKALQDAGINLANKNMNFSLMKQNQQNNGHEFAGNKFGSNDNAVQTEFSELGTLQEIRMGYSNQAVDISV